MPRASSANLVGALLLSLSSTRSYADIIWGTATAAYQIEGSRFADDRQLSIWDAFDTEGASNVVKAKKPNGEWNVAKHQSGLVADEDYVRYNESVMLSRDHGFRAARMSISWPRVMKYSIDEVSGHLIWEANEAGIAHYKKVLKAYHSANISVALTMFHWDLPLLIEEHAANQSCGSAWLCHEWIGQVFEAYAELLLTEFRDYVSWWLTINEPLTVAIVGYQIGVHAPGRCSDRQYCWAGDSSTEPYAAGKGMLLAHARAFRKWEALGRPGKSCGITLSADWRIPATSSEADKAAAIRSVEFQSAFFADPIHFGHWPVSMSESLGNRLPPWLPDEIALIKGSHDDRFFMNSYTTNFARERPGISNTVVLSLITLSISTLVGWCFMVRRLHRRLRLKYQGSEGVRQLELKLALWPGTPERTATLTSPLEPGSPVRSVALFPDESTEAIIPDEHVSSTTSISTDPKERQALRMYNLICSRSGMCAGCAALYVVLMIVFWVAYLMYYWCSGDNFCDQNVWTSGYDFSSDKPIGTPSSNGWLFNYGPGLGELVAWYNQRYKGLTYVITENGWGNATQSHEAENVLDMERCLYYRDYIGNLSVTVALENIPVEAYFAWSLMDNFEWADGYTTRFGLTYVDYETQRRVPKFSATWFRSHVTSLTDLPRDGKLTSCIDHLRSRQSSVEALSPM